MTERRFGEDDSVASLAVTLDGYIARPDGAVDYLENYPSDGFGDFSFDDFLAGIGAIIMGRVSYMQAVEWGWQWTDYPTMVLTSQQDLPIPDGADVRFCSAPTGQAIADFAAETPKRLWVFGGGAVITEGLKAGAVDTLDLMVVPEAIGSGLPLFTEAFRAPMRVHEATACPNGALRIVYRLGAGSDRA